MQRALEIGAVLQAAVAAGRRLVFWTLTLSHRAGVPLGVTWGAVQYGWRRSTSGRRALGRMDGVEGYVRVAEVTHGRNGWHPHLHGVLVLDQEADWEQIAATMQRRWAEAVATEGFEALPQGQHAVQVWGEAAAAKVAKYCTDIGQGLGMELTHTSSGRARGALKTRQTFELLADVLQDGDADSMHLWWEWERESKGRRMLTWSRGLRERYGLKDERTDEEIAAEEVGSKEDDVFQLTEGGWLTLIKRPNGPTDVLDALELGGPQAAAALLVEYGVEFRWVHQHDHQTD